MKSQIRGLRCGLPSGGIQRLLLHLSKENASFWVISCDAIRRPDQWLPDHAQGFQVATDQLLELSKLTIWELVLQLYPKGATPAQIETYEDFENSDCLLSLIKPPRNKFVLHIFFNNVYCIYSFDFNL